MKITIHTNNIYKSVTTILVVAYFLAILCVRSGFPAIHHSCIFLAKKVPVSRKIYAKRNVMKNKIRKSESAYPIMMRSP